MDIILASASPRRHELLLRAQLNFEVMSVNIDETAQAHEPPKSYIQRMIVTKATTIIEKLNFDNQNDSSKLSALSKPFVILTADTIGVLPDGKTVLVKPADRAHAYRMWQQMSDNSHQVWTAVQATLVALDNGVLKTIWQQQIMECTEVTFVPLTPLMMSDYWDSGEPADKAGAYGIQGLAAAWVTRINGSYTNVVGLPLAQTLALIDEANKIFKTHNDTAG